jgi:hypothetical protein
MNFNELLNIVKDEPVFDSGLLLTGSAKPHEIRRQLSRWSRRILHNQHLPNTVCSGQRLRRFKYAPRASQAES